MEDRYMIKSLKRNPHKREELLRKLKPLIIKSVRKYYNDFSQFENLVQQGYEVILKENIIQNYDKHQNNSTEKTEKATAKMMQISRKDFMLTHKTLPAVYTS